MNIKQLNHTLDSLENEYSFFHNNFISSFLSTKQNTQANRKSKHYKKQHRKINIQESIKYFQNYQNKRAVLNKKINKFYVELHRKLTLPLACIIMLIIGAPIGAIIKKGGFGLPVVFSIFLFLLYHILSITTEKMVKKDLLEPLVGMWTSTVIMLIIGMILIVMVNNNYFEKIWRKKY